MIGRGGRYGDYYGDGQRIEPCFTERTPSSYMVVCLKCEQNFSVPEPVTECPVCGGKVKKN